MPRPEHNRDLKVIAIWRWSRSEGDRDLKVIATWRWSRSEDRSYVVQSAPPCECKTGLDLERRPSGKFDTNALAVAFAPLAYAILRWMGPIL